ncbi:MAG: rhodanese-like domain-containing protein [Bacteroidaceae bacterium]|nr:rhodanese-like domain-containing protein [Bacteroidaceae bacterium]
MKTVLYILFAATMMVGCNNSKATKSFDSVDASRFAEVIEDGQVLIIDTRSPEEFNEGHIPGAVNINIDGEDFEAKVAELDKSRPVAVYCRGGRRSKEAAAHMVSCGLDVTELSNGILSWQGDVERTH